MAATATVHLVLQRPLFFPFLNTEGLEVAGKEVGTFARVKETLGVKQSRPQSRISLRDGGYPSVVR